MAKKPSPAPLALVQESRSSAPVKLDAAGRKTVQEALRLGEDLREELEAKVTAYGRWLLASVFNGDAAAALDTKTKNSVWLDLMRRAGGPTLRISRKLLYVSLSVAARDKRIPDQSWRGLDGNRKELLLPLANDQAIREAAQHVSKFNLSLMETHEYVTGLLSTQGKTRQVRLTKAQLTQRVRTLHKSLGSAAVLRRIGELRKEMDPKERAELAAEVGKARDALANIAKSLIR